MIKKLMAQEEEDDDKATVGHGKPDGTECK